MKKMSLSFWISCVFLIITAVVMSITSQNVNNISELMPSKMLYLNGGDINIDQIVESEDNTLFELGISGKFTDKVITSDKEFDNVNITYANTIWLKESIKTNENLINNYQSNKNQVVVSEDLAKSMGIKENSKIEIAGEKYTVLHIYKNSKYEKYLKSDDLNTMYINTIPKGKNIPKMSAVFGRKEGRVFFKNDGVETLKNYYNVELSPDKIIDLQPTKKFLKEVWKIYFLAIYMIFSILMFINATKRIGTAYQNSQKADVKITILKIVVSVLQIGVLLWILNYIVKNITIPQQLISPNRFLDISYYVKGIKHLLTNSFYSQNLFLEYERLATKIALLGYSIGLITFIMSCICVSFWIKKFVERKIKN